MTRSSETNRITDGLRRACLPLSTSVWRSPMAAEYVREKPGNVNSGPVVRACLRELDFLQYQAFGRRRDAQVFTQSTSEGARERVRRQMSATDVHQCSRDDA